ncbi:putative Hsp90 protein [Cryptosporidium serpentis]
MLYYMFYLLIISLCLWLSSSGETSGVPEGINLDSSMLEGLNSEGLGDLGNLGNIEGMGGMGGMEGMGSMGSMGGMGGMGGMGDMGDMDNVIVDEASPAPAPGLSTDEELLIQKSSESYEFQAEVSRLMDIIINSLYSQKDVFLRELLSNSADALEKARFTSVTDKSFLGDKTELEIRISYDMNKRTISITDTGVGMTRHDLVTNLGTVAKSGTANFLESLAKGGDLNLIGQFGVGFYASFLVADRVTVISKNNEDEQYVWESNADVSFRISLDPRGNTLGRGTSITLTLKEDSTEFLSFSKLKELALRYSQFTSFPIYIYNPEAPKKEKSEDSSESSESDLSKGRWELVNVEKAIWLRPKEDITSEEYTAFYKSITHDYMEPMRYLHFSAEGEIEFKALLYIPSHPPHDMFDAYMGKAGNIKLYVRRVLITDKVEDLLPKYLNFIKGVVDSDDISLNVAREHVQQSRIIRVISKKIVRKILDMIKQIQTEQIKAEKTQETQELSSEADESEESKKEKEKFKKLLTSYDKFYDMFHKNLKLGCYDDESNRSKIVKLLKFHSSKSTDKTIFLSQYIERMKPDQKTIYYISGESPSALLKNPLVSVFLKHDVEVLFLTEGVDEPCIARVPELEGFKLSSIEKNEVRPFDETEDEKTYHERLTKHFEPLLKFLKDSLSPDVLKVEVSKRLVHDPAVLTAGPWGQSAFMQKIQKAQTFADNKNMNVKNRHMEINPHHILIQQLLSLVQSDNTDEAKSLARTILNLATIASGFDLDNPNEFASNMYKLVLASSGLNQDEQINHLDLPAVEGSSDSTESGKDVDDEADDEVDNQVDESKRDEL